jgi:hypothetical protein
MFGNNDTLDGAGAGVIITSPTYRGVECLVLQGTGNTVRNIHFNACAIGVYVPPPHTGSIVGPGNVFSDNLYGVLDNGNGTIITGNRVGTNAAGTAVHSNGGNATGVYVRGSSGSIVGGTTDADRNVISGNGTGILISGSFVGIEFPSNNAVIKGNYIGTDVTGTVDLGNLDGITVGPYAHGNTIGGSILDRNIIAGNTNRNIRIEDTTATHTTISRNYIGLDADGTPGVITNGAGVSIGLGSTSNTIGPRNVISGNTDGVRIADTGTNSNVVKANFIGTAPDGMNTIPNTNGVIITDGARSNMIGGVAATDGNVIRGNSAKGVQVIGLNTLWNSIRSNAIHENGIMLQPGDQIDNVGGGNTQLQSPDLVWTDGATLTGWACPNCSVDIFSGTANNPRFYEGTTTAGSGGNYSFTVPGGFTGTNVMATATDLDGNTSEVFYWLIVDQDNDTINDARDPDDDNDSVLDTQDLCAFSLEDIDGFEDGNGCPDPDNDGDGRCDPGMSAVSCEGSDSGRMAFFPPGHAHGDPPETDCRSAAEDFDGFKDGDGCPEPDNDNDSHLDATDDCAGSDHIAGPDGALGAPQDTNHNGVKDASEATFTTDDLVQTFEDFDGVLDADGCHDSPGNDFDGDGYTDDVEALFIGTNAGYPCGNAGWPSDLDSQPLSFNELDIFDLTSFIAPLRRLDTSPPAAAFSPRWDLTPGTSGFGKHINILDVTTLLGGKTGNPPMFGNTRAFGKVCPLAP